MHIFWVSFSKIFAFERNVANSLLRLGRQLPPNLGQSINLPRKSQQQVRFLFEGLEARRVDGDFATLFIHCFSNLKSKRHQVATKQFHTRRHRILLSLHRLGLQVADQIRPLCVGRPDVRRRSILGFFLGITIPANDLRPKGLLRKLELLDLILVPCLRAAGRL